MKFNKSGIIVLTDGRMFLKRLAVVFLISVLCLSCVYAEEGGSEAPGGTKVGGHIRMSLFDYTSGIHRDAVSSDHAVQYTGMGFLTLILFVQASINKYLSIDVEPMLNAVTGATPVLTSDIGAQLMQPSAVSLRLDGVEWTKAVIKYTLAEGFELSAGIIKPIFTMEYGSQMFWQEELSGGKFCINNFLGMAHSAGFEGATTFTMDDFNMPIFLYLLNGETQFIDNNTRPSAMIHIEPAFDAITLSGSFMFGRYDNAQKLNMMRWSCGASYSIGALYVRGEYAGGRWEKAIAGVRNATPVGYYLKVFYSLTSWLKLRSHFEYAYHNFSGFTSFSAGPGEEYVTNTPGVIINFFDTLIEFRMDIANWKTTNKSDELNFYRTVIGWRATF